MIALLNLRLNCRHQFKHHTSIRRSLSTAEERKYYDILNVNRSSSAKEIKESFLKLSKIYHPDNKDTGSHLKFVQLKEAYDAIKDGPPVTTSSSYTYPKSPYSPFTGKTAPPNSYSNYDYYSDVIYQSQFKERQRAYKMGYSSFGGRYARSSTPWEDLRRDHEYKRRQQHYSNPRSRPLINMTLFFGAIAWIVIYSGVMLLMDMSQYKDSRGTANYTRDHESYLTLQEARRRRKEFEARQISHQFREKSDPNSPKVGNSSSNNEQLPKDDTIKTSTSGGEASPLVEPPSSQVSPV